MRFVSAFVLLLFAVDKRSRPTNRRHASSARGVQRRRSVARYEFEVRSVVNPTGDQHDEYEVDGKSSLNSLRLGRAGIRL